MITNKENIKKPGCRRPYHYLLRSFEHIDIWIVLAQNRDNPTCIHASSGKFLANI